MAGTFDQAKVDVEIDQDTSPITITYDFEPGPVYRIENVTVELMLGRRMMR